jgi:hypothetical protein
MDGFSDEMPPTESLRKIKDKNGSFNIQNYGFFFGV